MQYSLPKDVDYQFEAVVGNNLTRCDIYVPKYDLVIQLDGPVHYQELPLEEFERPNNFEDLMDLSPYMLNKSRLIDRLLRAHHKRVLRFDYQAHNIL